MRKVEITIEIDEPTLWRARGMARDNDCTVVEIIEKALNKLALEEPPKDHILGMCADDPDSVDEMLEEVMKDRAAHPLNQKFGWSQSVEQSIT